MARLTLYGFYKYDPTLFNDVDTPTGMDKDTIIRYIMKYSGDLYPWHQSLPALKVNIADWFRCNKYNFSRMFEAYTTDFNILDNFDRMEEWTDTNSRTGNSGTGGSDTVSNSSSGSNTRSGSDTTAGSSTSKVAAFNSEDLEPREKSEGSTTVSYGAVDSMTNSGQTTTTYGQTATSSESGTAGHLGHIHGNLGLTRSDQMIEYTADMYARADVYRRIARLFEAEFLIQIY